MLKVTLTVSVGMDIPDYIAASGANSGAISSMSSKMRSMGRKKRIRECQFICMFGKSY